VSSTRPVIGGTFTFTVNGFAPVTSGTVTNGTASASFTLTGGTSAGSYGITAAYSGSSAFLASSNTSGALTVNKAAFTITANDTTRSYGVANLAFTVSYNGFVPGKGPAVLGGALSFSTPAVLSSPPGPYVLTPSGLSASNYCLTFTSGTLTVAPAPLLATGQTLTLTAGAPFSGVVATFTNADPFGGSSSYTATITWGDGHASAGILSDQGGGTFAVRGSNTYADPQSYTVHVLIQHQLGYTTSANTSAPATVTSLGSGVQRGQAASTLFWASPSGQALLSSFNGGPNATGLANWLALSYPNLYGAQAGAHNLFGKTNTQVASFYRPLMPLSIDAEVLATAFNVYASTLSLGGTAAQASTGKSLSTSAEPGDRDDRFPRFACIVCTIAFGANAHCILTALNRSLLSSQPPMLGVKGTGQIRAQISFKDSGQWILLRRNTHCPYRIWPQPALESFFGAMDRWSGLCAKTSVLS
jgi:hypothetical protein